MGADLSAAVYTVTDKRKEEYGNMKTDWKRKLTSRKLWLAVATLVTGLILAFGGGQSDAQTVSGCIMSLGSVVAYIVGEGLVDRAHAGDNSTCSMEDNEDG